MSFLTSAVGSVLGGIGGLVGGIFGAKSSNSQSSLANQQQAEGATVFGEQQGYAQMLQQLMANPSSITKTPGYQFNLDQGAATLARQMGAAGLHGSGNEAVALQNYGENYAMNTFNQQEQLLQQLSGLGSSVNPTQAGTAASSANTSAFNQLGPVLGAIGGGANSLFSGLSGLFGSGGGGGGGGGGSGSGLFGNSVN